jgi:hypothetical protein
MNDPRNPPWRYGRHYNAKGQWYRKPFMPTGSVSLTPFTHGREGPAGLSNLDDKQSPHVGKFTHPSGAPDNHLLTIYSPGPVNHQYKYLPQLDGGIYLIKNGDVVKEPAGIRLIKNDPNYNESWPRAIVPYRRIYGVDEPRQIDPLANDGGLSPHLPQGTPFGLVGTSSMYKRESYPNGVVPEGEFTSRCPEELSARDPWKGLDAFTSHGNGMPLNWHNQGADAGLYSNDEIHAVRILAMEPTTDRHRGENSGRRFFSHAMERLRVLGEIPVRKFNGGTQPPDPDGNPDTSFLAKIPADTAFTFQTLDKHGLMLNMAQTWHQLRPGEIRTDCGGCHAHSQQPTLFDQTAAARPEYKLFDLTERSPLLTKKSNDQSARKWDADDTTGLRYDDHEVVNVEYWRDVKPILQRSCVACHSAGDGRDPAGNLNLDVDDQTIDVPHTAKLPGTYYRLAADEKAQFGHKPIGYDTWGYPNASRYIRKFQSRRSLLAWKIFGRRLDGFSNDDHPSESQPGARDLVLKGEPVDMQKYRAKWDIDFVGRQMPPAEAVRSGKVEPLSDEDRRTLVRWMDIGCPIDLDYDPASPEERGFGWMCDDNRPIVALTLPQPHHNAAPLNEIVIGLHDYYTGLDLDTFTVTADFAVSGAEPGENIAPRFEQASRGVWRWRLNESIKSLREGRITVSIKDKQGNINKIERTFSVVHVK